LVKKLEDMTEAELREQAEFCLSQRKAIRGIVHYEEEAQKEPLFIAYGKRLDEIIKEAEKRKKIQNEVRSNENE
jgi:dTDP-4-dehydrorhamnose 3,5-epimerase-like enzyme